MLQPHSVVPRKCVLLSGLPPRVGDLHQHDSAPMLYVRYTLIPSIMTLAYIIVSQTLIEMFSAYVPLRRRVPASQPVTRI